MKTSEEWASHGFDKVEHKIDWDIAHWIILNDRADIADELLGIVVDPLCTIEDAKVTLNILIRFLREQNDDAHKLVERMIRTLECPYCGGDLYDITDNNDTMCVIRTDCLQCHIEWDEL